MNQKKSFVLYFDAEDSLRQLCASQRGELLSALFDYARCIETEPVEPAVYAARCPNLRSGARMAFCFMASAIARDTRKWHEQRQRRSESALNRHARERGEIFVRP